MKKCLLSDDITLISGQHLNAPDLSIERSGIPYLTGPTDFCNGRPNPSRWTKKGRAFSESGDILVVVKRSGTGASFVADTRYALGRQLMAIRPKNWNHNFVRQIIAANARRYQSLATGLIPGISRDDILNTPSASLKIPEQRKIAGILSTWDDALEKLDALIATKIRKKQALMQQLLSRASSHASTGRARHRLGEVCERVTRKNGTTSDNVLTISAQGGLVNQRDYFNRSVAGADLSGYYLLKRGEFAYNRSSAKGYPFGAIKRLDHYYCGVVSTLYLCFRIKAKAPVDSNYLCQYFEAGRLNSGLRSVAKEGARAHGLLNVTADEFFDIDIFLPSLAGQQQIAAILDTAHQELTLLRAQRQTLDQQKRGLMQRLLTGKTRVKP